VIGFGSPDRSNQFSHQELLNRILPSCVKKDGFASKQLHWNVSDPFEIYENIHDKFDNSFILESSTGPEELAKRTFLGFDPTKTLQFENGALKLDEKAVVRTSNPLKILGNLEREFEKILTPPAASYFGGLVGYVSYDLIRYLEDLPAHDTQSPFPDFKMGLYLDGLIHESRNDQLTYFSCGNDRSSELKELLQSSFSKDREQLELSRLNSDFEKNQFKQAVNQARDYIHSGDIYQTVLSRKLQGKYKGDPLTAYERLRRINPSPYMYHLEFGQERVIGSSPEKLASVRDGEITTYPIAGTRPLGDTDTEKEKLAEELMHDEKEKAEHNMLVDLARNDVGRVSAYGSVNVPEYMEIKEFSHVQHLVSKVTGEIKEAKTASEVFGSLFPAGTVSGAPKIRAMEIIDELELTARGPYAGAVGYLSFSGDIDSCITIRSMFTRDDELSLRAGAGIVADSAPESEWEEINHKLAAMKSALAGGDSGATG